MRQTKTTKQCLDELKAKSVSENLSGMARFGIDTSKALGVSMPNIRQIAKTTKQNHILALELWQSEIHEARILASLVEDPKLVTRGQMDEWAGNFQSWDVCDQVCGNLFDRLPFAREAINDWSIDQREFVKRAAFAMIAWQAVHLKKEPDEDFTAYFPLIKNASNDKRNFVKKAVNWALRQIGKRRLSLYHPAYALAEELANSHVASAPWIGKDAIREFDKPALKTKLGLD